MWLPLTDIASSRHVSAPCEHGLVPLGEGFKLSLKRKEPYAGTALSCRTAACLSKTRWFGVFVATWPHDRGRGGPTSAAPCPAHSFHGMSYRARLTNWLTDQLETVPSNWQKVSVKDLVRDVGASSSTGPDRYPSMIRRRIVRTHAWCPTALRLWRVKALHGAQRSFPKMPFDMKLVTEGGSDVLLLNVNCQFFSGYDRERPLRAHRSKWNWKSACGCTVDRPGPRIYVSAPSLPSTSCMRAQIYTQWVPWSTGGQIYAAAVGTLVAALVITVRLFAWVSQSSWRTPRQLSWVHHGRVKEPSQREYNYR